MHQEPSGEWIMAYTTIDDPTIFFNTVLYSGSNGTQSVTGINFQPDFSWLKCRSTAYHNRLFNSVSGAGKNLISEKNVVVDFAMRYGNPSIKSKIENLHDRGCENLVILPLYPQYAAATTATVCDEVYRTLMKMRWQPSLKIVPHYESDPLYIDALGNSINKKIKEINKLSSMWTIKRNNLLNKFKAIDWILKKTINGIASVVMDLQPKLVASFDPNEGDKLMKSINLMVHAMQFLEIPLLVTEQVPQKLGHTVNSVRRILSDVEPISKSSFSCPSDDKFNLKCDELLDVDGYILAGIETHICVYQTGKQMSLLGKHVEVVADAVSSRNKTNHNVALDRIRNSGGFLTTTEMILFELKGNAEGDVFRGLSKLVK